MLVALKGEDGAPKTTARSVRPAPQRTPGAFLTAARLAAWGRLAVALGVRWDVFVTDSPAVTAALQEADATLRPRWAFASVAGHNPAGRGALAAVLAAALRGAPDAVDPGVIAVADDFPSGQVFVMEGGPAAFCRRLASGRRPAAQPADDGRCLLVALEPR